MANDDEQGKTPEEQQDDSGIDNLPPLSSFDSSGSADEESDGGLPPLGTFDSDKPTDSDKPSVGGLPPIDDISVETPTPTGGYIKPPPPGFESAEFESPGFETPPAEPQAGEGPGTSFQDLQADSDFSPETPEIGPGPDTDLETPMFDSAFGGEGGESFTPAFETPAPTQAMETPMFGQAGPPQGDEMPAFDEGAFTPDAGLEGTPPPDFGPDTGVTAEQPAVMAPPLEAVPAGGAAGGLATVLMLVAGVVFGLLVGAFVGPTLSNSLGFIPNPLRSEVASRDTRIADLQNQVGELMKRKGEEEGPVLSPEKIKELMRQQDELTAANNKLEEDQAAAQANLEKTQTTLEEVRGDLEALSQEYVTTQEAFEDLQNQTSIVQARQLGLKAEVQRLTGMVGALEDADARRSASKDALAHSVDQLTIQIKEGIPLTPQKYSRADRLAAAEDLKQKVAVANWVTPALLNAYTDLYGTEMEIAASTEYFFAKIPVTTRLGDREEQWAECLMKGNWSVVYRSLDGKSIGLYENIAAPGDAPVYGFRDQLPKEMKNTIEQDIFASRVDGFEEKIVMLAEKQEVSEGETTKYQRAFDSL